MALSARSGRIGESATLRVSRRTAELRAAGRQVLDLGPGEPDFPSPASAVEAARRALAEGITRYAPAAGIPALREALAERYRDRYGAPWSPDEVVVTCGAKAALFQLALLLYDRDHEVVLHSPSWVSLPAHVRFCGAEPILVPTSVHDGHRIRAEPLLEAIGERTSAVLINAPCNPTGGVIEAGELRRLVQGCAERGVWLLADETYELFAYSEQGPVSAAAFAVEFPDTVIVIGSFSKSFAMTGWRVGYALGPAPLLRQLAALQGHSITHPTSFAMVGALAALREAEPVALERVGEFRARRDLVMAELDRIEGVQCRSPEGAFYAFPRISEHFGPGREDSLSFAERLLEEQGVAVVPGAAFGDDASIRLSFTSSRETLQLALERITAFLAG